jgi:hypothetical protein
MGSEWGEDDQECPWEFGEPIGVGPNDPCPVCGMLGTLGAALGEDLCVATARRRKFAVLNDEAFS